MNSKMWTLEKKWLEKCSCKNRNKIKNIKKWNKLGKKYLEKISERNCEKFAKISEKTWEQM